MTNKLLNALAWISLILAFFVFILSYANFPDEVLTYINANGEPELYLARDSFFYSFLALVVVINAIWMAARGVVSRTTPEMQQTIAGISLSQIFFNMFFATSVYFINILNSRENFNYSNFGYLIYVTGGLLIVAIIYTLVARLIIKK